MNRHAFVLVLVTVLAAALAACQPVSDPAPAQSDCGNDDPRVGRTAVIDGHIHNVGGTARIADNCTIVIENFTYDGIGLNTRVVGVQQDEFLAGNFANGVILSEDIRREGGYNNETLVVHLPEGVTLDDAPVISINCVPLGFSFGEAAFE